jgi:superfamily I DNA/RNA helicase
MTLNYTNLILALLYLIAFTSDGFQYYYLKSFLRHSTFNKLIKDDNVLIPTKRKKKTPNTQISKENKYNTTTKISSEQLAIIASVNDGNNVVVNAVAGSGKTTTIVELAKSLKNERILALMYNTRLKDETRSKKKSHRLNNLEVHSFHSFGVNYYKYSGAKVTKGLVEIVDFDIKPVKSIEFDILIIDECQDLSLDLFLFVHKILTDNSNPVRILLLGDYRQNIYRFLNSDDRYLTLGEKLFFQHNNKPWIHLELRTTYRLSKNIGTFVNKNMLGVPLFNTVKPSGPKVTLYRGNPYEIVDLIAEELNKLLSTNKSSEYSPEDIFIVAPSIRRKGSGDEKGKSPLNVLENKLALLGYPCYHTSLESPDKCSDEILYKGKILVTNIHQTKGLERKIVVLFKFEDAYFDVSPNESRDVCPNTLYVACTRCKDKLILVGESKKGKELKFLRDVKNSSHLEVIDIQYDRPKRSDEGISSIRDSRPSVTQLVKYLTESVHNEVMKCIKMSVVENDIKNIPIAHIIETENGLHEQVRNFVHIYIYIYIFI